MLIYVMRHGIAQDRDDPDAPPDPERQLTRKGAARTAEAVRGLRVLGVEPGAILTSPYLRAAQTAAIAARELGVDEQRVAHCEALLPGCDPARVFAELLEVAAGEVLLVGHAPSLDEVLAFALGGGRAPFTELKKAGVACVAVESLAAPRGRLLWLLEPKALRALGERAGRGGAARRPEARHAKAKHAKAQHAKAKHAKAQHAKAQHAKAPHAKAERRDPGADRRGPDDGE